MLNEEVDIPPRSGNLLHYYVRPDDGRPLIKKEQIAPWQWEDKSATGEHLYYEDTSDISIDDGEYQIQRHPVKNEQGK